MATNAVEQGPTAKRVAANVAALRRERRITLAQLSAVMTEVGRPILPSGLSKIEQGDRRVDVDDLVALALALDVSPNRLLLPGAAGDDPMELSGEATASEEAVWRWATGETPLAWNPYQDPRVDIDLDRSRRWRVENRPYVPPSPSLTDLEENAEAMRPVVAAMREVVNGGVKRDDALLFLQATLRFADWGKV